jgi:Uma2 family endonuclease
VQCAPIGLKDKIAAEPIVIFEVMSESSWHIDSFAKNREYAATPSVRRYIMLTQAEIGGTVFERAGDDWVGHAIGPDTILRMPEIGVEVPAAEFYEGIGFLVEGEETLT